VSHPLANVRQHLLRMNGVVSHSKFGTAVLSIHGVKEDHRRLAFMDKKRHSHHGAVLETAAGRARLFDWLPTDSDQDGRVVGGDGIGVSRAIENHLGSDQLAAASANNATQEPEFGSIDQLRRQLLWIAKCQIGRCRTFRVGPGQEAGGELPELTLALRLRRRTAHLMTSRPPM
jgi:hypothetical protein